MFYIVIEWHPGGYVIAGEGETEAAALADLNHDASEFPDPPPTFASVQELRDRFANPADPVSSLMASSNRAEFRSLLSELDVPLLEDWLPPEPPDGAAQPLSQWEAYGMLSRMMYKLEGDERLSNEMYEESRSAAVAEDSDVDLQFDHGYYAACRYFR